MKEFVLKFRKNHKEVILHVIARFPGESEPVMLDSTRPATSLRARL